jgi:hypothetical protein
MLRKSKPLELAYPDAFYDNWFFRIIGQFRREPLTRKIKYLKPLWLFWLEQKLFYDSLDKMWR